MSCRPSRFSSERIWRLTAGCVTPSCSAACDELRRSTTAQSAGSRRVSISDHHACTSIGNGLTATQLDEVPQFINALRGDMSLVGPRPIRPVFFEELAHELPAYWQRLIVRPGLTGLAQVRRGYETSMAEKLAHDLEWIADRSVRLYLRTVVATGWRVLRQSLRGPAPRGG